MTNCKLNIVFEEQSHCENTGVADRQFALFVSNRHRIVATHTHIGHNWCAVRIVTFPRHYELNIGGVSVGGRPLWFAADLLFFLCTPASVLSHFPLENRWYQEVSVINRINTLMHRKTAPYEMEDCVENLCCKENLVGKMAPSLAQRVTS